MCFSMRTEGVLGPTNWKFHHIWWPSHRDDDDMSISRQSWTFSVIIVFYYPFCRPKCQCIGGSDGKKCPFRIVKRKSKETSILHPPKCLSAKLRIWDGARKKNTTERDTLSLTHPYFLHFFMGLWRYRTIK